MNVDARRQAVARRSDMADAIQYRAIYAVCFAVFLLAASLARLMPWTWLAHPDGTTRRPSIFEQASEAAGTCTTYAFMS